MPSFHVYVEGPADQSVEAMSRLADAMSERYGLAPADLIARLAKGRFRVKAGVDRETADSYQRDLIAIGARVVIEEIGGSSVPSKLVVIERVRAPGAKSTKPPAPATAPPPVRPTPTPTTPPAPPEPARVSTPPPMGGFQSGLSAAYSGGHEKSDLGALASMDSGNAIALSAVDGSGDEPIMENQYSEPAPPVKAKPGAAEGAPKAPRPKDVPVDMFAPPDGEDDNVKVEIAADEIEHRARKRTPPVALPVVPVGAPSSPVLSPRKSAPVVPRVTALRAPGKLGPLGDPRLRLAAGVIVAILIGFVPAHVIASMREHTIYGAIDTKVQVAQNAADTMEEYNALDSLRAEQLNEKYSERRMIAFTTWLIWAAAGGALAYIWFRRVPWDRLDAA